MGEGPPFSGHGRESRLLRRASHQKKLGFMTPVAEVVNGLIRAVKEGQDVDLNQLKMEVGCTNTSIRALLSGISAAAASCTLRQLAQALGCVLLP